MSNPYEQEPDMKNLLTTLTATAAVALAGFTAPAADLPLDQIKLPDGFSISVFADAVPGARTLAVGDKGTVFVGTRRPGKVHAFADTDGDNKADKAYVVAEGLTNPNGVIFQDGSLYVGEISRILRYDDIENKLDAPPEPVVVTDALPTEAAHGSKYLSFGPDGRLYFGIGAPCDSCDPTADFEDDRLGTITSMNADGSDIKPYVSGVRNSVGLAWHPKNGTLYFTDNGRDGLGDDVPDCELNRVTEAGQHFGNPYFHAGDVPDPVHGEGKNANDYVKPVQNLGPHVTPLGLHFYTGKQFPKAYKNRLFIALKGSSNRTVKIGYSIKQATLDKKGNVAKYEDFATGWLYRGKFWGRPVDVQVANDGALLVSDEQAGVVYRIAYTG
jgi:glucose/arabinose dehydrogenase